VITYTIPGCTIYNTASKTIVVNPTSTANAGTISGSSSICSGTTSTYTSNGQTGGVWSSSNTSIASVNASTGLVKGLAIGSVSIRYTVTPACGNPVTSSKTIQVKNCSIASKVSQGSFYLQVTPSLEIDAYPNPSFQEFTLTLEGERQVHTLLTVTDVLGNIVFQVQGPAKSKYVFGKDLMPGIYFVQVMQGDLKKSVKVVKQ
jgi:Secretion system C-terminal sorting domain/Bacterial Ig-like domain (group 2)